MMDQHRPDWVILGVDLGQQVMVYASKALDDAALSHEMDYGDVFAWPLYGPIRAARSRHIELTVGMRTYLMIVADTYPEALRRLFEQWSPDDTPATQPAAAIEEPRRTLEAGRPAIGPSL